jgi:hemerythrin superfamily protein
MTTAERQDVVAFLLQQHEQIKDLFRRVEAAEGTQKRELFEDLVRLLAVHEAAEEQVVHPAARRIGGGSEQVVEARLREEHDAKHELAKLYDMGVDHPDFNNHLAMLAQAVTAHADREQAEEFPRLRQSLPEERLRRMAGVVQSAEALAPTRPHPNAGESATANLLVGPPLAVFDRARDRMRDWRESNG